MGVMTESRPRSAAPPMNRTCEAIKNNRDDVQIVKAMSKGRIPARRSIYMKTKETANAPFP